MRDPVFESCTALFLSLRCGNTRPNPIPPSLPLLSGRRVPSRLPRPEAVCYGNERNSVVRSGNEQECNRPNIAVTPTFAVPPAHEAVALVNRWLHRNLGAAVHAASATFDPATFYWHVPIELAYGASGPLGAVGDV
jgi:hypothetical protein